MRTIAFVTQKGGAGKTTLAASLAVAAAGAGERVIALDFDPQGSLARWGQRRGSANAPHKILVEQFEAARLPRLQAILQRIADSGFTLAVFDTPGADSEAVRVVAETADICLLPARPTHLDVEATAGTFRAIYLAKRKAAFVLNQCPPTPRSARASDAAKDLTQLGVLAEPMLVGAHRLSGCGRERPRRDRICRRRPGGAGNSGAVVLDRVAVRASANGSSGPTGRSAQGHEPARPLGRHRALPDISVALLEHRASETDPRCGYRPTADASSHQVVPCSRPAVFISTLTWLVASS